jgi:hypothetical protein
MAWIELHQTLREHRKMFACADALNLSRVQMIGTLVSLWLWALDNAQNGSLAGVSDKTIARVCDFPEKKAGKLVAALAEHGFLDYDGEHYFIHDWFDYAGKLMERREKDRSRKRKSAKEIPDNSTGIPAEQPKNSHATVPIPYHTVPNHKTEGGKKDSSCGNGEASAPGNSFTAFWDAYPQKIGREKAWEAWKDVNPSPALVQTIMNTLDAWKKSEQWLEDGGRFIPRAAKWLSERHFENPPAPAKQATPKGASGELGEAELEAIQRILKGVGDNGE